MERTKKVSKLLKNNNGRLLHHRRGTGTTTLLFGVLVVQLLLLCLDYVAVLSRTCKKNSNVVTVLVDAFSKNYYYPILQQSHYQYQHQQYRCHRLRHSAWGVIPTTICAKITTKHTTQQQRWSNFVVPTTNRAILYSSLLLSSFRNDDDQNNNTTSNTADLLFQRTKEQFRRLQQQQRQSSSSSLSSSVDETIYRSYIQQSATALKRELQNRQLDTRGRKPDLAQRLTDYDLQQQQQQRSSLSSSFVQPSNGIATANYDDDDDDDKLYTNRPIVTQFAGIPLSNAASRALSRANFIQPTPIQEIAIPAITNKKQQRSGESYIVHAETGSGKTIAYLLPITEQLWKYSSSSGDNNDNDNDESPVIGMILLPTRELAAQVASIATTLAPPGSVRFISTPTNLVTARSKERGEISDYGGYSSSINDYDRYDGPKLLVGSAKTIYTSLYGNPKTIPVPPTSKPEAMLVLRSIQYLVLDEVDRLLLGVGSTATNAKQKSGSNKQHEKPAAVLTAAITRLTYGKVQIVAASATVGRPLVREVARVLGVPPKQGPPVLRASMIQQHDSDNDNTNNNNNNNNNIESTTALATSTRIVTLPPTVQNYIVPVMFDGTTSANASPGKLLTTAYQVIQVLHQKQPNLRMLLVLTRNFGITTTNVIGSLQHFHCRPKPQSLLDVLEVATKKGTDPFMNKYQQVTGSTGIGESATSKTTPDDGYLYVTGEDTIRGLHFDGLDIVIIAGRPAGVDEYVHIAGRTGRAGTPGIAISIVPEPYYGNDTDDTNIDQTGNDQQPPRPFTATIKTFVSSWERMLNTKFYRIDTPADSYQVLQKLIK